MSRSRRLRLLRVERRIFRRKVWKRFFIFPRVVVVAIIGRIFEFFFAIWDLTFIAR